MKEKLFWEISLLRIIKVSESVQFRGQILVLNLTKMQFLRSHTEGMEDGLLGL